PASTPMALALFRAMAPDQVLLPPDRFSRAPVPPTPVPLRTIDLAMLRPLPRIWTLAPLATTVGAPPVGLPRGVLNGTVALVTVVFCSWRIPWLTSVWPT